MTTNLMALALLGALVMGGGPASADPAYDRCIDISDGSNAAWGACGTDLLKREDERLNVAWKRVFSQAAGQTKADLLAEQRAWIAFKDASCAFLSNGDFGREGQVLHFASCRARIISERTRALDRIRDMLNGEM